MRSAGVFERNEQGVYVLRSAGQCGSSRHPKESGSSHLDCHLDGALPRDGVDRGGAASYLDKVVSVSAVEDRGRSYVRSSDMMRSGSKTSSAFLRCFL